jgi:hypothetical protein
MANEGQDLTVSFLLEAKIRARSCNRTFVRQQSLIHASAQPKKHASESASISCTRSFMRSLDDNPGYSCHFRSARCQ